VLRWLTATKVVNSIELSDPDDENASGAGSEFSTGVDAARSGTGKGPRCSSARSLPSGPFFGRRSSFLRAENGDASAFLKTPRPDFVLPVNVGESRPCDGFEGGGALRSLLAVILCEQVTVSEGECERES
jgi:hypothetical protein